MFRLSKITDYGIVLLAHLAKGAPADAALGASEPEPHNARELAADVDLPVPVVSKVLKLLARGGILESQRGSKGGYALARPAQRITVAEVIDALEGPVAITECAVGPSVCLHEVRCAVRDPITTINQVVRDALRAVTLADLVDPHFGASHFASDALRLLERTPGTPPRARAE